MTLQKKNKNKNKNKKKNKKKMPITGIFFFMRM